LSENYPSLRERGIVLDGKVKWEISFPFDASKTAISSQGTVSLRLKFHDKLPMEIKEYIARAIIAEMPEPVLDVIINNGNFAKIYNNIQLITCAPTKRW